MDTRLNQNTTESLLATSVEDEPVTNVQYSYLLVGGYGFFSSFFSLFVFFMAGPTLQSLQFARRPTQVKSKRRNIFFIFHVSVLFGIYVGLEMAFGGLITSFVVKGLGWENRKGTFITSVYWGCLCLGRLVAITLSFWASPRAQLNFCLVLINASLVCTMATVYMDESVIWICTAVFGAAMGPMFGALLLWTSEYITVTGPISTCLFMGISAGMISCPPFMAYLLQTYGAMSLVYFSLSLSSLLLVLFLLGQIVLSQAAFTRSKTTTDDNHRNASKEHEETTSFFQLLLNSSSSFM